MCRKSCTCIITAAHAIPGIEIIANFYILDGSPSLCKEWQLTIPCNGVDEARMAIEDGSRRPRMTSMTSDRYIGAPATHPPYQFLHRTSPGKKRKSGPKYPKNIGPQAKICPQNVRSHIGHIPRLPGVLLRRCGYVTYARIRKDCRVIIGAYVMRMCS